LKEIKKRKEEDEEREAEEYRKEQSELEEMRKKRKEAHADRLAKLKAEREAKEQAEWEAEKKRKEEEEKEGAEAKARREQAVKEAKEKEEKAKLEAYVALPGFSSSNMLQLSCRADGQEEGFARSQEEGCRGWIFLVEDIVLLFAGVVCHITPSYSLFGCRKFDFQRKILRETSHFPRAERCVLFPVLVPLRSRRLLGARVQAWLPAC
jgi:hypothetical protein